MLVILLAAVGAYRYSLIDRGRFHFGDERIYKLAVFAVDELLAGRPGPALQRLTDDYSRGRPGFVLVSTVPAAVQWLAVRAGLARSDRLSSYDVPATLNVAASLAVSALVYVLGRAWLASGWAALTAAAAHALLIHSSLYVRHLVPYDTGLALLLLALYLSSTDGHAAPFRPWLRGVLAGALAGLGLACYPGYYVLPVMAAAAAAVRAGPRWPRLAGYAAGALVTLALLEGLWRLAGRSCLAQMRELSGTITMGDFTEGYVYLWRYLRDVEGPAGLAMLILAVAFVATAAFRPGATMPAAMRVSLIVAVLGYLVHATLGVASHFMVFYGRLLHAYLPFVVLAAVAAVMAATRRGFNLPPALSLEGRGGPPSERSAARTAGLALIAAASVASFMWKAPAYARPDYPGDVWEQCAARFALPLVDPARHLWVRHGGRIEHPDRPDPPLAVMVMEEWPQGLTGYVTVASHDDARRCGADFILVNFNWMFLPESAESRFQPPDGYALVAEAPHPNAHPGNAYEAYGPAQRQRLRNGNYSMRIYRRQPNGPGD